jgi:NTP pyrophosphatase (non-canonical NTP hydrolase)
VTESKELDAVLKALYSVRIVQHAFRSYQDSNFPVRPPEFFALELAGEAGEVANNEKKVWKGRNIPDEELADEAADVFIALMNYANSRNIDLGTSVHAKLEWIEETRITRSKQGEDY